MKVLAIEALVGIAVIAGLLFAFESYTNTIRRNADKLGYGRAVAEQRQRENEALKQAIADKARLEIEVEKVSHDAREKTVAADAANAAAAAAGLRLRAALAARSGDRQGKQDAPAGGGASADSSSNLRADVQRRLDEAADGIAGFADKSRIAGLACEADYRALK